MNGTYRMFIDAWKIGQENGIANLSDFGASNLTSTHWVSGYDRYFRIMQNRVDKIDSLNMTDTNSLRKMKQWLFDHGNGSSSGGLVIFTLYMYGSQETTIPSGVEAGKSFFKYWGTKADMSSQHAMTIVGYNDSVRFDFNGDKKFTNNVDISNHEGKINSTDGKIDMADWEIGAIFVANTWGTSWGDKGFAYAPYRSLFISYANGGTISNNRIYYMTVKKNYTPKMALKASITHSVRNAIALSVGAAPDPQATVPSKIRSFDRQFTYAGGAYPMCGKRASSSIEIGLDVSDLLDSIDGGTAARFFLVVDSKASGGIVDSLSLMDYSSGTLVQTKSSQTKVAIATGTALKPTRTYVGVAWNTVGVSKPSHGDGVRRFLQIKTHKGMISLRVPDGGVKTVRLLNARGEQWSPVHYNGKGEWLSLKGAFPPAVCFVSVTLLTGKTFIQKIVWNR